MDDRPFTYASYLSYLTENHLMGSRCSACQKISLPPRPFCPSCGNNRMEWVEMPTRGRLMTFTCIHVTRSHLSSAGYNRQRPYCVGVVELENGARMTSRIMGVDPLCPEDIPIGLSLQGEFVAAGGEYQNPAIIFRASEKR